jgi:hypothetical protein
MLPQCCNVCIYVKGEIMIIKPLIHHGNSRALLIDKLLQAAGLDEDPALFQITIDPNGGIIIQSVKAVNENLHNEAFRQVLKENDDLIKRLSHFPIKD